MQSCYTELVPPTAVTHAVSLPFVSAHASNLVVAKTSLLQLFKVKHGANGTERLVLLGEYTMAGTVTSIARINTIDSMSGGEALLLAFKDAKLSLIEWDPENHRIRTVSIHFYEGDNVLFPPYGPELANCDSVLTVDPSSRCAALKFGARQLAILPFRQSGDDLAGEEDGLEDGVEDEPTSPLLERKQSINQHTNGVTEQTPYKASFVLPLITLDPTLSHTVHLTFLHEYREPTFGILSAPVDPSYSMIDERKDILTYTVLTLDLERRESTNLITVPKLPSTLWKVIPLPLPIGGALLVGVNELVHVDQGGKVNATAVNEFAKLESDFGMADQAHLSLQLEDCSIEILDSTTGEMLIVTKDGYLAIASFRMQGRNVGALNIRRVDADSGMWAVGAAPSCTAWMENGSIFIGSEDGPSFLLGWTKPRATLSRKRSHAQMLGKDEIDGGDEAADDDDDDDDDLYDAASEAKRRASSMSKVGTSDAAYQFSISDELRSLGSLNDMCLGKHGILERKLELAAGTGRSRSSRLAVMSRDIVPELSATSKFDGAKCAWAVSAKQRGAKEPAETNDLLFVFNGESTAVYDNSGAENRYTERNAAEFEREGETLEVSTLAAGQIIVQCRKQEVRTYDANLGLDQIIPMLDEETDQEFNIVHVSFCDPYLLVIRDDSSIQVLSVQGRELEPLEAVSEAAEKRWLSGCVYSGELTGNDAALFLLSAEGGMSVFSLPDLRPILALPTLPHLPPVLSAESSHRRVGTKETLTELLVSDIGHNGAHEAYLILRTALDDVALYEPFRYPPPPGSDPWHINLRFRKVPLTYIPKYNETMADDETARSPPLKGIDVNGYRAVAIPGAPPCLLLREASSLPKILEVRDPTGSTSVVALSPLHRKGSEPGFFTIRADGELQENRLNPDAWYGTGWSVSQTNLGDNYHDVRHLSFHEGRGFYVVATCKDVDFYFAEEDNRHPEQDDIELRPKVPQYSVHLVSSKSHRILHTIDLPFLETVTALKVMTLEVSENTHEQKSLVVVSTSAQRGEDMPAKGAVIVFDIIDVVPDPEVPESGCTLYQLAREETRGAITALAGPLPGGFVGTAQGLKLMVRGLKEDGTCLPVAFFDAQTYTHTLKTLPGTGMWLAGDAWKGLSFGGFTEEPYKLTRLGKTPKTNMEVMTAEFLPFDGALFILIMDADCEMHVMQYDPDNPNTQSGARLLHRSTFNIGHFVTKSLLLPSTLSPFAAKEDEDRTNGVDDEPYNKAPNPLYHVLTTSTNGSIGLVTPLDEAAYRLLSGLQTHLTSILEHAAGLNPRAYRAIASESAGGAKGVIDGSLVRRIVELGASKRADVLGRAGGDVWALRSDLEVVGGGGLGYL